MTKGTVEHDVFQIMAKYPIVDILNAIFDIAAVDEIPIMKQWFYDMNKLTDDPIKTRTCESARDTNHIIEQLREKLEREIERLDGKIGRLDRERSTEEIYKMYEPYVATARPGAPEKKFSEPMLKYDNRIGIVRHIGVSNIHIGDNHIPLNRFGEGIVDRIHPEVGDTVGFNVNANNGTLVYLCIINKGKKPAVGM